MKIKPTKTNIAVGITVLLLIIIGLVILFSGSSSIKQDASRGTRIRRDQVEKTSTTIPSSKITTTTKSAGDVPIITPPATDFIVGATYLNAAQLQSKWTSLELCSLLSPSSAKEVLEMTVDPVGVYSFSEANGAKCIYNNGEGDEIAFQVSVVTFENARTIDVALGTKSDAVLLDNGAYGVSKSSKSLGYVLSLNVYGTLNNEVLISAPSEKDGKRVGILITDALKAKGL